MRILGVQNTPCGHYDHDRDIQCDAIVCTKIGTADGVWHLHRYFDQLRGRSPFCTSSQWVFVKQGWSAKFDRKGVVK